MKKNLHKTFFFLALFLPICLFSFLEGPSEKDLKLVRQLCCYLDQSPCPKSLPDLITFTQKHWLRPKDKERWELAPLEISKDVEQKMKKIFKEMGVEQAYYPKKKNYEACLFLGSSVPVMEKKLLFLESLIKGGVRFHKLYFLVADRPLDPRFETHPLLTHEKTETEAARRLFLASSLAERFSEGEVCFLSSPMVEGKKRPTTEDNVEAFLKAFPSKGEYLAISFQPTVLYQRALFTRLLPREFSLDFVSPQAFHGTPIRIYLDAITRWLYQFRSEEKSSS